MEKNNRGKKMSVSGNLDTRPARDSDIKSSNTRESDKINVNCCALARLVVRILQGRSRARAHFYTEYREQGGRRL